MPKTRGSGESKAFRERLGRHIAAARAKADGLTLAELAAKVGVSVSTVSDWEHGRKCPSAENVVAVARATRESVAFLLSDGLARANSLEMLSRELGTILGQRRLGLLLAMPERRLLRDLDALLGEALASGVTFRG